VTALHAVPEEHGVIVPYNFEAETELVGAMLVSVAAVRAAKAVCSPASFSRPSLGLIFGAIVAVHDRGDNPTQALVTTELARQGVSTESYGGPSALVSLVLNPGIPSTAPRLASLVAGCAALRQIQRICAAAIGTAGNPGADVPALVDGLRTDLAAVALPTVDLPPNLERFSDFLRHAPAELTWLIPGVLPKACRCLVVAAEGSGKSMLARTFTLMCSQGRHPFTLLPMEPIRVLLIDAENPDEAISTTCKPINDRVLAESPADYYDEDRSWLWHERRRLNLRSGTDRARLERVVDAVRPDLICLGPLYKLYAPLAGERDAQAAEEMADALDELVARYGVALIVEHHAPKAQSGRRPLDPFGSQRWLAWPELGISLNPVDEKGYELAVSRFRGDRLPVNWPTSIKRGAIWPWEARYSDDSWKSPPGLVSEPPLDYQDEEPF
jgi:replicative DNA helicase